jgi:ribosome-binding protein aMBF1 (putative translation factor)
LFSDLRTIKLASCQGGGAVINRAQVLKTWIEREGRKQTWVAQQVGCSPQWLNYILQGKKPMSDKLARALRDKLGIPLIGEEPAIRNEHKKKAGLKRQKGVVRE